MAKDPAFLFYSSDFLTGTMLMNNEQTGKYIRLLCLQHQKGVLSESDMLKICSTYDEDIWNKFSKVEGGYLNERLHEEIEKRFRYTESRRNNRKKKDSEKDMSNICNSYVQHMENENENIIDVNITNTKKERLPKKIEKTIFDEYLDANCPTIRKLKIQMTGEQAEKLMSEFGKQACHEIFDAMENWVPLPKKSKSVYLTARTWLSKRNQTTTSNGKSKPTFTQGISDWLNQVS